MTEIQPKAGQRLLALTRRLGAQAALSVCVMAGLHLASVNGYDVRDLLPARPPQAEVPAEPARVVGVPVRFDLPVQAGSALDHLLPKTPGEDVAGAQTTAPAEAPKARSTAAPAVASLPSAERVAVPTPRPRLAAAAAPAVPLPPAPVRTASVPPPPADLPFDVSPPEIEVYDVAELVRDEAPPTPADEGIDVGLEVGGIVPTGSALLRRTAEVTGSAAHVVTGAASRILDLVR